jgi:DNA-binding CsgD family transcriptional regulator
MLSNQYYYITDVQAQCVVFVTPSVERILGYEPKAICCPQFMYDIVHPDDREAVCLATAKSLLCGPRYPFLGPFDCTFSIVFRVQRRDRTYVRILRQTTLYSRDRRGNMHLTLAQCTTLGPCAHAVPSAFGYTGPKLEGFEFPDEELLAAVGALSKREQQIVRLLARGKRSSDIAYMLAISPNTVNTHRRKMMTKTGARNTAQLIAYAHERGYLG